MPILVTPACTDGAAVGVVDVEDAVHPHQPDDHRIRHRQAPPESEVPAPRGTTRTPLLVAEAHDGGDLFGGLRQHDGERRLAVGGQAVGLVGLQAERLGDQPPRRAAARAGRRR